MAQDEEAAGDAAAAWAGWLQPYAALELLDHLHRRDAIVAVFNRLRNGYIQSIARRYKNPRKSGEYSPVDPKFWTNAANGITVSPLWSTGDITIPYRQTTAAYGTQTVELELFGVRLDPAGVRELLPSRPAPTARRPEPTPARIRDPEKVDSALPEPRGPEVSRAHLRAWYEVYRQAYPGTQDTEEMAMKSATGMFPGKTVVRKRIRELRGAQKVGRKPRDKDA